MNTFCSSCGMPLSDETSSKVNAVYCQYCVDEKGVLQPKQVVQAGVAEWLKQISPNADDSIDYLKRASSYLNAMPAWAED